MQKRFDDDEKRVKNGDRPFTKAKRSNCDVLDQNELQTYASLEKMLHKAIFAIQQLKKKGNTNTSSAPKHQCPLNAFDIGAYNLGLGSFVSIHEGDTYLGELVELNQSDTYISELDELSELSDTILEVNDLSDTEEEAGLVAMRNGPFSGRRKIHKKFNLGRFYTKFDQAFGDGLLPICIKKYQQKESKSWSCQALDRGYNKSHSASLDDPFNPSQFQKCRLPSRIISNTQLK
ncbi:hypothetical protein DY000_02050384 [Brassica cretica]|uniref:Uncharacterized protein n=1 Tax=Brassica cretica TaxID=69181 RepID=A0ABQ7EUX8_BRACR|nr:hypothetical protein DY000_02050384 [Brassica cretica]